ncbi:hypothetical protein [Pseudomonas syringae]|uniref:hypothetical protein n=1 Tax=Pseudomonas syringae TaxID=317 RepID=UPI000B209AF3
MTEVAVIAYGAGNVASVQFALERLGATVRLTDDPVVIAEALSISRRSGQTTT